MLQFSINFIFYVLKGCGSGFWHVMLLSEECINLEALFAKRAALDGRVWPYLDAVRQSLTPTEG